MRQVTAESGVAVTENTNLHPASLFKICRRPGSVEKLQRTARSRDGSGCNSVFILMGCPGGDMSDDPTGGEGR